MALTPIGHPHQYDNANNRWVDLVDGTTKDVIPPVIPPPQAFFLTVEVGGNDARNFTKAHSYDLVRTVLGRDLGGRLKFYGGASGTIQDSLDNRTATGSTEPHPVICFKSFTTAQVNARLAAVTAPESWTWFQEFYGGSVSAWNSGYNNDVTTMRALKNASPNGHFIEFECVTSMAEFRKNPGHFTDVDETVIDSWGADSYNARTPPYTGAQLFQDQRDAWRIMKVANPSLKWVVSEWGVPRQARNGPNNFTDYTGPQRVAYAQAQVDYAIAQGCSGMTYWATDNSDVNVVAPDDHSIKDWSIDKGTAADNYFAAWLKDMLDTYPVF